MLVIWLMAALSVAESVKVAAVAEVGVPLAAVADLAHGLQAWVHQQPPSL